MQQFDKSGKSIETMEVKKLRAQGACSGGFTWMGDQMNTNCTSSM